MLTRIGETLGKWIPRSSGGDPLAIIRSGWTELVGIDVARAAQPVAIANESVVVITASSAWSHQLAFLEPEIMRAIRELVPTAEVVRLRFRVGTIRMPAGRRASAPIRPQQPSVARAARSAPLDRFEALARFRAVVERSRSAHVLRGGTFCEVCAAPVAGARRCVPCADWARAALEARCQRLLYEAPWLPPQDVLNTLPELDPTAYDVIRRQLLRAWWDEMALARKRAALPRPIAPDRARLRKIASSYVLLETKLDPNHLEMDSPVRRNALGDLYDFIRRVELGT